VKHALIESWNHHWVVKINTYAAVQKQSSGFVTSVDPLCCRGLSKQHVKLKSIFSVLLLLCLFDCLFACLAIADARVAADFLYKQGLRDPLVHQIVTKHGAATVTTVTSDPYTALKGLPSASWSAMEHLAAELGYSIDAPSRGAAALLVWLRRAAANQGHTQMSWRELEDGEGGRGGRRGEGEE
jgi:hypothetical protein